MSSTVPAGRPSSSKPVGSRTRNRKVQERTRARVYKERIRVGVRGVGEILITLGLVLLLFCGYQLWWTDVTANAATKDASNQFEQTLADTPVTSGPIPALEPPAPGEPFARMYVPRFGENWVKPIIQGVELRELHKGVGHYEKSAMPGEVGNFAVAGHRTTNGRPFRKIDDLQIGDKVFVETKYAWYTYQVSKSPFIVDPRGGYYVISPSGTKDQAAPATGRIMTLTSCHPPYSAAERIIAQAKLVDTQSRAEGPPAGVSAA